MLFFFKPQPARASLVNSLCHSVLHMRFLLIDLLIFCFLLNFFEINFACCSFSFLCHFISIKFFLSCLHCSCLIVVYFCFKWFSLIHCYQSVFFYVRPFFLIQFYLSLFIHFSLVPVMVLIVYLLP